jgi:AcrR family transcriptional regulator
VAAAYRAIATHGYPDTSVDVIAREAGLARGLVHYYFETKEELVVASIEQACLEMEILSGSSPGEALEGYLRYDTYLGDPHRTFFRVLLHLGAIALYNPRLGERLRSFLADTRAAAGGLATHAVLLGILLQRELDPEFDARRAFDALVTLARAGDPTLAALADASVTPPVKAARR